MSKRWKTRKRNAARLEKSRKVIDEFYGNVIRILKEETAKAELVEKINGGGAA